MEIKNKTSSKKELSNKFLIHKKSGKNTDRLIRKRLGAEGHPISHFQGNLEAQTTRCRNTKQKYTYHEERRQPDQH